MTAALDAYASRAAFKTEIPDLDEDTKTAVAAWNMLDGQIEFDALAVVCDLLAVNDPELLTRQLMRIRDHVREVTSADARD